MVKQIEVACISCPSMFWFPTYLIVYQIDIIYFFSQYVSVSWLFDAAKYM